jgi:hypothetical protein
MAGFENYPEIVNVTPKKILANLSPIHWEPNRVNTPPLGCFNRGPLIDAGYHVALDAEFGPMPIPKIAAHA